MIDKRFPVISDGFAPAGREGRGHFGVDVMFRRPASGAQKAPVYAKHFECPSDRVFMVAPADCLVKVAGKNSTGLRVQLDMGSPKGMPGRVFCYGTHMSRLLVEAGQVIQQGTRIGIVGADPRQGTKGLNHMHFEIWDMTIDGKYPDQSIDPEVFMKTWGYKADDGHFIWPKGIERPDPKEVARAAAAVSTETLAVPAEGVPDSALQAAADAADGHIGE